MIADLVLDLTDRGFQIVPLRPRSKIPLEHDWQRRHLDRKELFDKYTKNPDLNAGLLLGQPSGGAVDVDIDQLGAITIAHRILPTTDFVFGRPGKPASHLIYRCREGEVCKGAKFVHPVKQRSIIELRGEGEQTRCVGSTNENGELIEFVEGKNGNPTTIAFEHLRRQGGFVATTFLLAEDWEKGSRHFKTLAFAGACAANGIPKEICLKIIDVIVVEASDEEGADRNRAVEDTYRRHTNGKTVDGMDSLRGILGDVIGNQIYKWMGMKRNRKSKGEAVAKRCNQEIATTDLEYGRDFAKSLHGSLIYCDTNDTFYERKDGVYTPISEPRTRGNVHNYLDQKYAHSSCEDETNSIRRMMSSQRINAILREAKTFLAVSSNLFDLNPTLVGCANGVLDLMKGTLVDTQDIITRKLGTHFDPAALCPAFERFVSVSFGEDASLIGFVQRAWGYTLSASTSEQCMFVCIGSGSNGKSTLENIASKVMGDYACPAPIQTLVKDKLGSFKTDDLAALEGYRYVFTQEGESEHFLAGAKIKRTTGGDPISVRSLYKDPRTINPIFKLWFFTNRFPKTDSTDDAIWRRLQFIPFNITITQEMRIPDLPRILDSERPGILNWMLKGFQEYIRMNNLDPPQVVVDLKNAIRFENDTVGQFIEVCCDTNDQDASTAVGLLHGAYVTWCRNEGIEPLVTSEFGKGLQRLNFKVKRTKSGNNRQGIRLKEV
ncbi:phage/plasmid primase, P4 family [Methylobacterium sp. J-070]|uniref:phage/plasmid primase, P4 family n=1 Tax=Methylobacterium sp. J-070 TaxID=2836650 RepID=UPI001FB88496|nr:phage/plasmid primase, P4 family [Methylobacterium sp. J-070]MCJ2054465.1 phage/plasmid primase, P4 family [Methylobacterium sp. J-070]